MERGPPPEVPKVRLIEQVPRVKMGIWYIPCHFPYPSDVRSMLLFGLESLVAFW